MPDHQLIPANWHRHVFTGARWVPLADRPRPRGTYGGFYAHAEGTGIVGYIKPTQRYDPGLPQAANEKIIADLAYELSLPVPPVLLYRRECEPEGESRCCVCAAPFPQVVPLSTLHQGSMFSETINAELRRTSGMVAFLTYVNDEDSVGGKHILRETGAVDVPVESPLMYIDHANALAIRQQWNGEGWQRIQQRYILGPTTETVDANAVDETVSRIERLPDEVIEAVVSRIPSDFLDVACAQRIIAALKGRRELLRAALSEYLT